MRGSLVKKPNSRNWYIVVDERAPDGRRKRRWIATGTPRKHDAENVLADLVRKAQTGVLPPADRTTVAQWLNDWLETRRVSGRAPKTLIGYRYLIDRITPHIGQVRLSALTAKDLERLYAAELQAPDKRFRKESDGEPTGPAKATSATTVRRIHDLLRAALRHAVKQGVIYRNPAELVTPPQVAVKEQKILTPEQVAQLLDHVRGHRLQPLLFMAVSTGMRESELVGLRWVDIDLDGARMSVSVQRQYLPRQGVTERETKEHRGARPIELADEEVQVVKRHKAAQSKERLAAGGLWRDHGLVFPSEVGTPLNPRNLQRFFDTALQRAGLPDVRFHDLRHTAGTLILREDGRVLLAQQRLGHSRASTTLDRYGHAIPGDQREAAAKVLAAINRSRKTNS